LYTVKRIRTLHLVHTAYRKAVPLHRPTGGVCIESYFISDPQSDPDAYSCTCPEATHTRQTKKATFETRVRVRRSAAVTSSNIVLITRLIPYPKHTINLYVHCSCACVRLPLFYPAAHPSLSTHSLIIQRLIVLML